MSSLSFKSLIQKCLLMIIPLLAMTSVAQVTEYNLWVNGVRVTSTNKTISCDLGTAVFDGNATLTLNGVLMTKTCEVNGYNASIISHLPNLSITTTTKVSGKHCVISNEFGSGIIAVPASGTGSCKVTINNNGTQLSIFSKGDGIYATGAFQMYTSVLKINSSGNGLTALMGVTLGANNASYAPQLTVTAENGDGVLTTNAITAQTTKGGAYLTVAAGGNGLVCNKYTHSGTTKYTIKAGKNGIVCDNAISDSSTQPLSIEAGFDCFKTPSSLSISQNRIHTFKAGGVAIGSPVQVTLSGHGSTFNIEGTSDAAVGISIPKGTFENRFSTINIKGKGKGIVLGSVSNGVDLAATLKNGGVLDIKTELAAISAITNSTLIFFGGNANLHSTVAARAIELDDAENHIQMRGFVKLRRGPLTAQNVGIGIRDKFVWKGTDTAASWDSPSSWDKGVVPTKYDLVRFESSMELPAGMVPDNFCGVIEVASGASLTATFDSLTETPKFSAAIERDASFVKKGQGTVQISPFPGTYGGDIAIAEGTVIFSGNGYTNAPGFFGDLTVSKGANVIVKDSPFAYRHGAMTLASQSASSVVYYGNNDSYPTVDNIYRIWEGWFGDPAIPSSRKTFTTPPHLLSSASAYSSAYLCGEKGILKGNVENWGRAVMLSAFSETRSVVFTCDDTQGKLFVDKELFTYNTSAKSKIWKKGWHALDWRQHNTGGGMSMTFKLKNPSLINPGDVITADYLWNGVCFENLTLEEGATLDIASGQAVAFAAHEKLQIDGEVTGAADSCFTIALTDKPLELDNLAQYSGKIEIGYPAQAKASVDLSDAAFSIIGYGELIFTNGLESKVSSDFIGTLTIPNGTTFTPVGTLKASKVTGTGTYVSTATAPAPTKGFGGKVVYNNGSTAKISRGSLSGLDEVSLSNGSTLEIPASIVARSSCKIELQDWTTGAWALTGKTLDAAYRQGTPYVDSDGALVMTDDGGRQRRSAFLTNVVFHLADSWQVSFTYQASPIGKYEKERAGEGLTMVLQYGGAADCDVNATAPYAVGVARTTANGIAIRHNETAPTGIDYVLSGKVGTEHLESFSSLGFNPYRPINVNVSFGDRRLLFKLEQDGKTREKLIDYTNISQTYGTFWLGFTAGTGATDADGAVVGLVQKISNFKGWVLKETDVTPPLEGYEVSSPDWHLNGNIVREDDTFIIHKTTRLFGSAINTNALDIKQGYKVSWRQKISKRVTTGDPRLDMYGAVLLQGYGTNYYSTSASYPYLKNKLAGFGFMSQTDSYGSYWPWAWITGNTITKLGNMNLAINNESEYINDVSFIYDGNNTIVIENKRPNSSNEGESTLTLNNINAFEQLGGKALLTIMGTYGANNSSATRYRPIYYSDIKVQALNNCDMPIDFPITIEEGALGKISVNGVSTNTLAVAATVENLNLANGASLLLTNITGRAVTTGLGTIKLQGNEQHIVTATNVTAALDVLDLMNCQHPLIGSAPLTLSGNWTSRNGVITIRIPSAWVALPSFDAVNLTGATLNGEMPQFRVELVNSDGSIRGGKGVFAYVTEDGMLRLRTPARTLLMIN